MNKFDEQLIKKYLPKEKWEDSFNKLASGYPVQYLIGNVDFYGCLININENVLIPRFETEYLVDDLIKLIKKYSFNNPKILDIGTGSGCISIALKKSIDCEIVAIDKSNEAIKVAKANAVQNNVSIAFDNISIEDYQTSNKMDIIVSNPPYIAFGDIVDEKTKYEPKEALYADDNGLYFYTLILNKSKSILNRKSIIAFEIGYNEADDIIQLAKRIYPKAIVIKKQDLNKFDRYIYIINE